MPVYEDNTKSIGRTPLVRINRLDASSSATILAKIEGRNPAYSVDVPHRRRHGVGRRRTRHAETGNVHRRSHQRQYRHCARMPRPRAAMDAF